jgi:hypothetical protein
MNRPWINFDRLERLKKTVKDLSQDSRSLILDLNAGPSKYEARVLTSRPRRSVGAYPDSHAVDIITHTCNHTKSHIHFLASIYLYITS